MKKIIIIILVIIITINIVYLLIPSRIEIPSQYQNLPKINQFELSKHDGTNDLPIYIVLNGLVYDVTAGKEFYASGGPYQYLAGRDSSKELNLIGGNIIKQKYPVIGIFLFEQK